MLKFKRILDSPFKGDIDKLIFYGKTSEEISRWIFKFDPSIKVEHVKDYLNNWIDLLFLDSYKDYLWVCEILGDSWVMIEYDVDSLLKDTATKNNFRRELIIARTEYILRGIYRNGFTDEKAYRELSNIILTAMAHQEKINLKSREKSIQLIENKNSEDTTSDISAVDETDLEKYLYKKSPQEQEIIRQFLVDMNRVLKIVDLNNYVLK